MNYKKLMSHNPTKYGEVVNSLHQKVEFYEHPIRGDGVPVIAVCHELELALYTDFFELDDMVPEDREYEPLFVNGELKYGYEF